MTQQLNLEGELIEYVVKRSTRAQRLRLTLQSSGQLIVVVPMRVPLERISSLLLPYAEWILRQRTKIRARVIQELPAIQDQLTYRTHRAAAQTFVTQYLESLSLREHLPPYTIQIKNHRTRWGSCSRRGNLNFNYRIVLLPVELAEYIIVHEVCHLYELNHSIRFWNQVARFLPDHVARRKRLRDYSWKKE
jgi:predicted metal-dependent hydrolase